MFKPIPKTTKEEILLKIKQGEKVMDLSAQYGVSCKTIYAWLRNQIKPEITLSAWNKLKRENEDLKQILGLVTLELERGKKNRNH
jgi:endo-beta-N-acetylglucosaminidase D